jgi:hypothetical protein
MDENLFEYYRDLYPSISEDTIKLVINNYEEIKRIDKEQDRTSEFWGKTIKNINTLK